MLIDNFVITREDDPAGSSGAAQLGGTSAALPAAEPVGIVGGHPAPAPAAADPEPNRPDADDEPAPGGGWLAHERPALGSGSGERAVLRPDQAAGPIVSGAAAPGKDRGSVRADGQFASLGLAEAAVDRFVSDYLQMLDGRLDSIRRCLDDSDIEGARIAVLSLESSSTMLGGATLAARLGELRHQLDLGPTPQRNALMSLVEVSAAAFRRDLESAERR